MKMVCDKRSESDGGDTFRNEENEESLIYVLDT